LIPHSKSLEQWLHCSGSTLLDSYQQAVSALEQWKLPTQKAIIQLSFKQVK
jgi:hypothetical protein